MLAYMPSLVLRTRYTAAAMEINGVLSGECAPGEGQYLALPLSGSGDYYIGVMPLVDDARRYYPVMRKLTFRDGVMEPLESNDMEIYAWPGGIYEAVISPGILPREAPADFPFTVDQLTLSDGCTATLYYEDGMRLAIEQGSRVRYGAVLGPGQTGRLEGWKDGGLVAITGDGPQTLLALNGQYEELLRLTGDKVDWRESAAECVDRLPTQNGHEVRQVWEYSAPPGMPKAGEFIAMPPERGFFTHTPTPPTPGPPLFRAFCEAVREGFYDEALSYMTPSLARDMSPAMLKDFFQDFTVCRPPLSGEAALMGLAYPPANGVCPVRVFSFTLSDGKIDDVSEE